MLLDQSRSAHTPRWYEFNWPRPLGRQPPPTCGTPERFLLSRSFRSLEKTRDHVFSPASHRFIRPAYDWGMLLAVLLEPLALSSSQRFRDAWLSLDGLPKIKFSTLISSSN